MRITNGIRWQWHLPRLDICLATISASFTSSEINEAKFANHCFGNTVLQNQLHDGVRPRRIRIGVGAPYFNSDDHGIGKKRYVVSVGRS